MKNRKTAVRARVCDLYVQKQWVVAQATTVSVRRAGRKRRADVKVV
ncbi:MAG: hypothetical protein LC098_08610 [Burkholderiales bacterium]|nr:hypothetical protein [Burkholderiales bacterium]